MIRLPFSQRTTAAVCVFACIGIAAPAGAQKLTSTPQTIAALQLEYAGLLHTYRRLRHQDTANNQADLDAAVNMAVQFVGQLNTTIDAMMASGDNGIVLSGLQVVVANALMNIKNVQTDEV